MKTAVTGTCVRSASSVDHASTRAHSLVDACNQWARDFADAAHRSAMTALRRVTTDYKAGEQMPVTKSVERKPMCLDLYASEFHFVLTDPDAPPNERRWSVDLVNGKLQVRTWDDAMSNCRTLVIERTGTESSAIEPPPRG